MTTSTDPFAGTTVLNADSAAGLAGGNVPPAFLPDPNLLARLANEFFQALPGRASTPSVAQDVHAAPPLSTLPIAEPLTQHGEFASLPVAPYVPPTAGFSLPTDADLRPAPASVAGLAGLPSPAVAPTQGAEPSYYFLEAAGLGLPGVAAAAKPPATPPVQLGSQPAAVTPPLDELRRAPASLAGIGGAPTPALGAVPESAVPPLPDAQSLYFAQGLPPSAQPSAATWVSSPTGGATAAEDGPLTEEILDALPASLAGEPSVAAFPNAAPTVTQPYFVDAASAQGFAEAPPGIPAQSPPEPSRAQLGSQPAAALPLADEPRRAPASVAGVAPSPSVPAVPEDAAPPLPDAPSLYFLEGLPPAVKPTVATQVPPQPPVTGTPAAEDGGLSWEVLNALPASLGRHPPQAVALLNTVPDRSASPYYLDAAQATATNAAPLAAPKSFDFQPQWVPELDLPQKPFDAASVKQDFPILQEQVHGRPLVWLDNAATTQKPNAVIERLAYFYQHENSNIHRAAHELAARSTDAYEKARETVRRFLNAASVNEIVFVRGATEGINLVAQSWGRRNIEKGDEIVITWLEHHANIVPWQQLCAEKGARLKVAPVDDSGQIIVEEYEKLFTSRTKLAAFPVVSNALGTVTPAHELAAIAHRHGARVLVDGAQSVSHLRADVQALDCDWFVFSGHKVFAPTGIGVVYGKEELLNATPPWQGGGNMIADVTFERTVYQPAPARFEAGTGNIADAVGLGAALDYLSQIGIDTVASYEHQLLVYGTERLLTVPGLKIIGTAKEKAGVLSFVLDNVRTGDVGAALNQEGIAVRAGHHCAQPILRRFGLESTVRASLALYNTCEDIDALVAALLRIQSGRARNGL